MSTAVYLSFMITIDLYNVSGQLSVQPTLIYKCPKETVTFTCTGRQVLFLDWIMEPYVSDSDGRSYDVSLLVTNTLETAFNHTNYISSKVINITELNGSRADMTLSLTIKPFNVNNGTNITCKSGTAAFGRLFLAGEETFTALFTTKVIKNFLI